MNYGLEKCKKIVCLKTVEEKNLICGENCCDVGCWLDLSVPKRRSLWRLVTGDLEGGG